jgi:hypothetical protein
VQLVALYKAIGGGWDLPDAPTSKHVSIGATVGEGQ